MTSSILEEEKYLRIEPYLDMETDDTSTNSIHLLKETADIDFLKNKLSIEYLLNL